MIEKIKKLIEEKIKPWVNRILDFINTHKKAVTVTTASVFVATAIIIFICVSVSHNKKIQKDEADSADWGAGITENIPAFSEDFDSLTLTEDYAAAYYSNVSGQQVKDYIVELGEECGVSFEGNKYPRTAVYEDKLISIHYNVTEMRFSVTVTQRES